MSLVALALLVFASDHHHPPVLVISEKGADARRQHMTALLGNAGIEFEFVDAFHVESGVVAEEDLHRTIGLGALVAAGVTRDAEHDPIGDSPGFKTDAELGCALSHAFALRLVSERQLSRALVLEDDVGFHTQVGLVGAGGEEEWQDAVGLVYDEFPEGHELVYLGWCLEHCERTELVSPHLWKPWRPLCTHSYIVTADGADKLLEDLLAVPRTLDHAFAGMVSSRKIAAYASSPALFMQLSDKFGSTNVARTVDVQKKLCLHEVAFNKGLQVMALGDMMEAHTQFTHAISFQPDFSPALSNDGLSLALLTGGSFLGGEDEPDTPLGRFHAALTSQKGSKNEIAGASVRNAELMTAALDRDEKVTTGTEGLQVLAMYCHHDQPVTDPVVGDAMCKIRSLDLIGFEPSTGRLHAEL